VALSPVFGTKFENDTECFLLRLGLDRVHIVDFQTEYHLVPVEWQMKNFRLRGQVGQQESELYPGC
jgi:hypothetical protein